MLEAQHQQQDVLCDEQDGRSMAALQADDTLPTSTQMSMQDMVDGVSASDSLSAPTLQQTPHLLPESNSVGQLSVLSDGSFIHVEGPASAEDAEGAEGHDGVQALTPQEDSLSVDLTGPAALEDLALQWIGFPRRCWNMLQRLSASTQQLQKSLMRHAPSICHLLLRLPLHRIQCIYVLACGSHYCM